MSGFLCAAPSPARAICRLVARDLARQTAGAQCSRVHTSPSLAPTRWLSGCAGAADANTRTHSYTHSYTHTRPHTSTQQPHPRTGRLGGRRAFFSLPKIIRDYEELPREYRDQAGLSFGRELSEEQADRVFGSGTGAARANRLLRILHGRRVAGTLEDPAFAVHTAQFDADEMAVGLAYLRRQVPVEEVRNAGLRAEDELDQMDKELRQRQDKERSTKDGQDTKRQTKDGIHQVRQTTADEDAVEYKVDPRYGPSKFDEMRARNLAREKAREKALEEEQRARELDEQQSQQSQSGAGPLARREDGSRAITNPKVQEYYDKAQSGLDAPPEMRAWERILPSATVVALVLGFLAAVAAVYEEPSPRYRLLREVSTAQATVGFLIAANVLVFLGWRVPPLWALFNRSMMLVVATVRPLTLFTAVFSHTRLSHLLANMVPLWFVGTALHGEVGRADFLWLYLGCGAAGFLSALATYTLRGWLTVTSMGASGATLGLCSAYFWEHRGDGFRILGLPEEGVHGIVFLAMMTALQLAALGRTVKLRVDVASHLGGMAAGILGIEMINRSARGRRRRGEVEEGTAATTTGQGSERGAK